MTAPTDPIAEIRQLATMYRDERFVNNSDQRTADHLDAYADLLAQPRALTWQPIETAPKDGSAILVHGGIAFWYIGNDCDGEWRTLTGEKYPGRRIEWTISHWMPLRALDPPAREQELRT